MYTYIVRIKQKGYTDFFIALIPVTVLLTTTIALQQGVGTDYDSYYSLAEGVKNSGWMLERSEFLFVGLIELVKKTGYPQLLFFVTGFIQVTFLTLIAYEFKKMGYKMHHYFFLYFALSLTFFNQFNIIRQYIAVYIVVYAIMKLIDDKKVTFISLIVLASLFHSSAIYFIFFIFLRKLLKKKYSMRLIFLITGLLLILYFVDTQKYIDLLLSYTSYSNYIEGNYSGRMRIDGVITKLPKLAITLVSSYLISKSDLSEKELQLTNLGYLGMFALIMTFSSTVIWRLYQYVDLLIIFPVLILFSKKEYKNIKIMIAGILLIILIIKIVFIPRGEYLYNSILF